MTGQTDRDRQTDRQTDRQADRQTGRQADRTDRHQIKEMEQITVVELIHVYLKSETIFYTMLSVSSIVYLQHVFK